jgi:hypothetical protein
LDEGAASKALSLAKNKLVAGSADFVLFEVCGFIRQEALKAADLQETQICPRCR